MLATPPRFSTATGGSRPDAARPRRVVDRRQRRPLPARRHVGGAEVEGHGHAGPPRQQLAVAELDGASERAGVRPLVQHRLAVEADQVEVAPGQAVRGQEGLGGVEVLLGHGRGAGGEDRRLRRRRAPRRAPPRWPPARGRAWRSLSLRSPAGPKAWIVSPSVSSTAMSTASSEVPLMNPRTFIAAHLASVIPAAGMTDARTLTAAAPC